MERIDDPMRERWLLRRSPAAFKGELILRGEGVRHRPAEGGRGALLLRSLDGARRKIARHGARTSHKPRALKAGNIQGRIDEARSLRSRVPMFQRGFENCRL